MHCNSSPEQIKLENIYGEQASACDILHGNDVFSGLKLSNDIKMVINGFCVRQPFQNESLITTPH